MQVVSSQVSATKPSLSLTPTPTQSILNLYNSAKLQAIEEAAIEMEWNGFLIDSEYFTNQAKVASEDLLSCFGRLRSGLSDLGIRRESPDNIWSSSKQLVALLHDDSDGLRLPPSPYWFKGRVNIDDGERKLDRTALEWVASRCVGPHAPARGIVEGVMELRRIGSSLKYLTKLPKYVGPDGFVHPSCGPASDEDDRVGAITGRRAMKNPEAHQIPRDKRKDRYHIRRGFVAPPGMKLVVRDYTALEVVIIANICEWLFGDTQLLDLTVPGVDIHAHNAYTVFGKYLGWRTPSGREIRDFSDLSLYKTDQELAWYRDAIKAVWYKLQYGGTIHGFATSLRDQKGEPVGKTRAQEIVGALYEAVPSVPKWQNFIADLLRKDGGICALDGRFVDYSSLIARGNGKKDDTDWAFQKAVRGAQNLPAQGTGAYVIGCAMVDAMNSPEMRRFGAVHELEVHDELRWRCPEFWAEEVFGLTGEIMQGAFPLKNLRTEGGIGDNWEQCK
jgi:DNA polymerase I-like protein with 3'-5' exonuclease and polymerase domains